MLIRLLFFVAGISKVICLVRSALPPLLLLGIVGQLFFKIIVVFHKKVTELVPKGLIKEFRQ
ncbi:hypothetical protein [Legionella sp. 29fVS95]|uniref:hypothetical protein n=1 Tax=Legionella sp. 29fVS95 TaxID=3402813 RepID=UPI003AF582C9